MSKEKKVPFVYVEAGAGDYTRLAAQFGAVTFDYDLADVIMFTGGADVSPQLYGEKKLPQTHTSEARDVVEVSLYQRLINRNDNIKRAFVGICRGGQFLNVMNGGKMWQHVEGHTRDHPVFSIEHAEAFFCSSTHHQMMRAPTPDQNIPYKVLAYALDRDGVGKRSKTVKLIPDDCKWEHDGVDIEAMWYPSSRSLCFQPHPEYAGYPKCTELFMKYINTYVLPSLGFEGAAA